MAQRQFPSKAQMQKENNKVEYILVRLSLPLSLSIVSSPQRNRSHVTLYSGFTHKAKIFQQELKKTYGNRCSNNQTVVPVQHISLSDNLCTSALYFQSQNVYLKTFTHVGKNRIRFALCFQDGNESQSPESNSQKKLMQFSTQLSLTDKCTPENLYLVCEYTLVENQDGGKKKKKLKITPFKNKRKKSLFSVKFKLQHCERNTATKLFY